MACPDCARQLLSNFLWSKQPRTIFALLRNFCAKYGFRAHFKHKKSQQFSQKTLMYANFWKFINTWQLFSRLLRFLSDIVRWQDVKWNMHLVFLGIRVSLNLAHICEELITAKFQGFFLDECLQLLWRMKVKIWINVWIRYQEI